MCRSGTHKKRKESTARTFENAWRRAPTSATCGGASAPTNMRTSSFSRRRLVASLSAKLHHRPHCHERCANATSGRCIAVAVQARPRRAMRLTRATAQPMRPPCVTGDTASVGPRLRLQFPLRRVLRRLRVRRHRPRASPRRRTRSRPCVGGCSVQANRPSPRRPRGRRARRVATANNSPAPPTRAAAAVTRRRRPSPPVPQSAHWSASCCS